jgi:RNA polymerase sigma-70 factor (ECF subfamily)
MQHQQTDNEVIQQVLQGNQQAFAVLVSRYQQFVFTIVLRYVINREEAEELAQDVFVKAYRYLADFKGQSRFSTWLYTITQTTCLSFLRKKPDPSTFLEEERLVYLTDRQMHTVQDRAEKKEHTAVIDTAISRLSTTDAQIITLFYKAEQSLEEIAQILGIPANTVKVKLHRARHRLKDIMETYFAQELPGRG